MHYWPGNLPRRLASPRAMARRTCGVIARVMPVSGKAQRAHPLVSFRLVSRLPGVLFPFADSQVLASTSTAVLEEGDNREHRRRTCVKSLRARVVPRGRLSRSLSLKESRA